MPCGDFGVEGYKKFVFNEYLALNQLTADQLVELMTSVGFRVVRQERRRMELDIPEALQGRFASDDLLTNEIFLLLGK
ncbi:MAG: Methyltransferase type 11 [Rhodoferax sp.]|nr:Methyltransferase type 11 [Rhodoferax sp.]